LSEEGNHFCKTLLNCHFDTLKHRTNKNMEHSCRTSDLPILKRWKTWLLFYFGLNVDTDLLMCRYIIISFFKKILPTSEPFKLMRIIWSKLQTCWLWYLTTFLGGLKNFKWPPKFAVAPSNYLHLGALCSN